MKSVDNDESLLPSAEVVVGWGMRRFLDIIVLLCFFGGVVKGNIDHRLE